METKEQIKSIYEMSNEELLEVYENKLKQYNWYGHMSDNYTIWKKSENDWNYIIMCEEELRDRGLEKQQRELYNRHRK